MIKHTLLNYKGFNGCLNVILMFQNFKFTQTGVFYAKFLIIQRKLIKANG